MNKAFQKVTVQDIDDLQFLREAAGKGKLCIVSDPKLIEQLQKLSAKRLKNLVQRELQEHSMPSPEQVKDHVRKYVSGIDHMATSAYRAHIQELWEKIISDPDFLQMLMPTPKARKCRDFNKYAVMRIMGILIAHNVYPEESKQTAFCNALEHSEKPDCSYRSYLGQGIEDRELRKRLVEYIEELGKNRQITE